LLIGVSPKDLTKWVTLHFSGNVPLVPKKSIFL